MKRSRRKDRSPARAPYNTFPTLVEPLVRVVKPLIRGRWLRAVDPGASRVVHRLSGSLLHAIRFRGRDLNVYFLSTGRCGTRFFARLLDTATNGVVLHEPKPHLRMQMHDVAARYVASRSDFQKLTVHDYPELELKVLLQQTIASQVYGETLHNMFPFGYMLYKYFGPERLRLIHLIRNPVACCRSLLKVDRDRDGIGKTHLAPALIGGRGAAEQVANLWTNINEMIRYQFEIIDDPAVCKTVRLEDVDLDSTRELFEFLHLKGFDERSSLALMADGSQDVRHSHVGESGQGLVTDDELDIIAGLCAPLAAEFGYGMPG